MKKKDAFTLVELLIVVAILAVLSGAAYIGMQRAQTRVMNEKVQDDLIAIANALEQYKEDNGTYPVPQPGLDKNVNCFSADTSYAHDCDSSEFRQSMVDNTLLTKRYLQEVPTDPRSGSRYVYGVSDSGSHFQVAGILEDDSGYVAAIKGNLTEQRYYLPALIRSYNSADFVFDGDNFLPYSPDPLELSARLEVIAGTVTVTDENSSSADPSHPLLSGYTVKTASDGNAALYFTDGSLSYMEPDTELTMLASSEVTKNNKDSTATKVHLGLSAGSVWSKVVRLSEGSEFHIESSTAIAGVKGTEFGFTVAGTSETLLLYEGQVAVVDKKSANTIKQLDAKSPNVLTADSSTGPKEATITSATPTLSKTPTDTSQNLIKKYAEKTSVTLSLTPYLVKAEGMANEQYKLFVAFNGFTNDNVYTFDSMEIFGDSQTNDKRVLTEDALKNPLMTASVTYDPPEKAYSFTIDYSLNGPLYNKKEQAMEYIILRAYQKNADGTVSYSQLSPTPIRLASPVTQGREFSYDNPRVYEGVAFTPTAPRTPTPAPSPLQTACTSAGGFYEAPTANTSEACWVLGQPGQACSNYQDASGANQVGACEEFGARYNVVASCTADYSAILGLGSWNVNNEICAGLVPGGTTSPSMSSTTYAPYSAGPFCTPRNEIDSPTVECSAPGKTASGGDVTRLCQCT